MSAPRHPQGVQPPDQGLDSQTMVEARTEPYSARTHGRPWIAEVTFDDPRGNFRWGHWIGQSGEAGLLVIEAPAGAVVATGQKRFGGRGAAPRWWLVTASGELDPLNSRASGYLAWKAAEAKRRAPAAPAPDPAPAQTADSQPVPQTGAGGGAGARGIVAAFGDAMRSAGYVVR